MKKSLFLGVSFFSMYAIGSQQSEDIRNINRFNRFNSQKHFKKNIMWNNKVFETVNFKPLFDMIDQSKNFDDEDKEMVKKVAFFSEKMCDNRSLLTWLSGLYRAANSRKSYWDIPFVYNPFSIEMARSELMIEKKRMKEQIAELQERLNDFDSRVLSDSFSPPRAGQSQRSPIQAELVEVVLESAQRRNSICWSAVPNEEVACGKERLSASLSVPPLFKTSSSTPSRPASQQEIKAWGLNSDDDDC